MNTYYSTTDGWNGWYQGYVLPSNEIWACNLWGNTALSNSGSRPDLQKRSTAGHEMGHCLGVDHSNVANALLKSGRNREVIFSPWQDDVNAINAKYGNP